MNNEMLGVIVTFLLTVILAIPLGRYIAKVFKGEKTILDFMGPLEKMIFRVCGIDPRKGNELERIFESHAYHQSPMVRVWIFYVDISG